MTDETLTLRELRDALGRRVDAAFYAHEATIVTKNGQPRAVLVPLDLYQRDERAETGQGDHGPQ